MLQRDQLYVKNVRLVLNVQQEGPRRVLLVLTVPQEVNVNNNLSVFFSFESMSLLNVVQISFFNCTRYGHYVPSVSAVTVAGEVP